MRGEGSISKAFLDLQYFEALLHGQYARSGLARTSQRSPSKADMAALRTTRLVCTAVGLFKPRGYVRRRQRREPLHRAIFNNGGMTLGQYVRIQTRTRGFDTPTK
jgi:hypothetical protein